MQVFETFNFSHLVALLMIFLLGGVVCLLAKKKIAISWFLAFLLIVNEIAMHLLAIDAGEWRVGWALPLHLCDLSGIALIIALIAKSQIAWELAYYWGIGGSVPALLTPDLPLDFPHFYFITFFIHHGVIVIGVLYLCFLGKYPLPFSSLKRVWVISHVYAGVIAIFNVVMQTNYLFLCYKPSQPSVIDYLGPWPIYLLGLELIFVVTLFVLYGLMKALRDE